MASKRPRPITSFFQSAGKKLKSSELEERLQSDPKSLSEDFSRRLLIVSGDVELNPGPVVPMNLKRLLRLLHDVRVKWYDIGIQLDISTGTLDAIKAQYIECGKCLREMLKHWLHSREATIDDLLEALSSEPVGENVLAENTRHLNLTIDDNADSDPKVNIKEIERKGEIYKQLRMYMIDCHWTGRVLGRGSFGTVLEMEYGSDVYAGKMYHDIPPSKRQFIHKLCGELLLQRTINHPNIVQTIGIAFYDDRSPIILMECMQTTLQEYILNSNPSVPLSKRAKLLCDVAKGLHYLHNHSPIIIHRDLTATNVLLDETLTRAKLSDFGNGRVLDLTAGCTPVSSQSGTLHYMPPEVLALEDYDSSLDIFSFGHLMLFAIIQEIPWRLLGATFVDHNGTQGRSEVERRQQYIIKSHQQLGRNHTLIILMERCLDNVCGRRPSAEVLVDTLSHVVSHDDINITLLLQQIPRAQKFQAMSIERRKAPQKIDRGAAVTHDGVAYFTPFNSHVLFKYEINDDKWTELPLCPQANFGLAIIEALPTAVGGIEDDIEREREVTERGRPTTALSSFNGTQWVKKFPAMLTPRSRPAVVTSTDATSVVAAGGWGHDGDWWTNAVEHYNSTTRCWTKLVDMPLRLPGISAALCGDQLYLLDWADSVYTCSLQALLKAASQAVLCTSKDSSLKYLEVWKALPTVPSLWSTPVSVCGRLVAVGGHTRPKPTNAIHLYSDGKWTCIGHMSYSRRDSIVAAPRDDTLVVVGGLDSTVTDDVEIISITT